MTVWRIDDECRQLPVAFATVSSPRPNQTTGPMRGHVRNRRVYKAPFVTDGALKLSDWVVDNPPDLLWPALVFADTGNSAARGFVQWQRDLVAERRPGVADLSLARGLDGTLSGLDHLARVSETPWNAVETSCIAAISSQQVSKHRCERAARQGMGRPALRVDLAKPRDTPAGRRDLAGSIRVARPGAIE